MCASRAPCTRRAGRGVVTQAIVEDEPRQRPLSVAEQQPLAGLVRHAGHVRTAEGADKFCLADAQTLSAHQAFEAKPRRAVDFFSGQRRTAEGAGNRMFRTVFQCGGKAQAFIAVARAERANRAQHQSAFGEGAGLVEDHRVDLIQAFQHVTTGQQQTEFVQCPGGCGERGRCCQRQRARAGRNEHGEDDPECAR